MASKSIGSIYAELTLKDKMSSGLKKAQASLGKFAATSAKWAGAGLAAGVTATSVALIAGAKHTLAMTDELVDMSAQTGVAVADMMKLQRAYADGGRTAENVGKDFSKMQKALVTATTGGADPFASLGLSAQKLIAEDPAAAFNEIGTAIMAIENPAMRTAKAMEIFGKGGMGLTTVFGGLDGAAKALGKMPALAQKFGAAMGQANDLIGHLPLKSDQFFMGFTAGIIGELLPQLQKIDDYDFTDLGQRVGDALATAFQSITDGTLWTLFQLQAEKAFTAISGSSAFSGWAASINTIFDGITSSFGDNFNFGETWDKYAIAGIEANAEITADLQKKIDELNASIAAKYKSRSDAAAALASPSPGAVPIVPTAEPVKPSTYASPGNASENMVNEYQRRGLSLDSSPSSSMAARQTELMAGVKTILEHMAGQLNTLTNPT